MADEVVICDLEAGTIERRPATAAELAELEAVRSSPDAQVVLEPSAAELLGVLLEAPDFDTAKARLAALSTAVDMRARKPRGT